MPIRAAPLSRGQVFDVRETQNDTRGGSSDTEMNELAAMPTGLLSTNAATAVTPLGKAAKVRRSAAGSDSAAAVRGAPPAGELAVTARTSAG